MGFGEDDYATKFADEKVFDGEAYAIRFADEEEVKYLAVTPSETRKIFNGRQMVKKQSVGVLGQTDPESLGEHVAEIGEKNDFPVEVYRLREDGDIDNSYSPSMESDYAETAGELIQGEWTEGIEEIL